ncbi:hypothetical protein [Kaistella antarctica]|uniref:DUF2231 domain-containing protein n=1 Tax=Kaistella antarctica TaxID=266748 RepID=A0A448NPJ8_9FLAO|nr:hypothetical protein [Kaistella antarctica]SEW06278.1 Uncharacterized membrane protein [Kaistella antarctica]VEH97611.1 Uncharacterised protein [Kaistella antarctica]
MDELHLHLVVNHLPIIFPIVGLMILLIGIFTKSEVTKRNAYIIFIVGAITSIAAMVTGENAENSATKIAGLSESLIEKHADISEIFAILTYFLGGISLAALILSFKNSVISKYAPFVVGILAIVCLFFGQKVGTTGGEIKHTEIRTGQDFDYRNFEGNGTTSKSDEENN